MRRRRWSTFASDVGEVAQPEWAGSEAEQADVLEPPTPSVGVASTVEIEFEPEVDVDTLPVAFRGYDTAAVRDAVERLTNAARHERAARLALRERQDRLEDTTGLLDAEVTNLRDLLDQSQAALDATTSRADEAEAALATATRRAEEAEAALAVPDEPVDIHTMAGDHVAGVLRAAEAAAGALRDKAAEHERDAQRDAHHIRVGADDYARGTRASADEARRSLLEAAEAEADEIRSTAAGELRQAEDAASARLAEAERLADTQVTEAEGKVLDLREVETQLRDGLAAAAGWVMRATQQSLEEMGGPPEIRTGAVADDASTGS